ncbi:zinc ribbon domain-containing protein [Limosilactobacillus caccae]|uniref:zinc ribbon domain-containing protein n=1 Tax=Limosilactobacillus caccae TaxID=1926284 RepID=UPI000970612B|nr:zinc ribbon domain-containing protein [Limosilactobacillus caccae]
MKFCPNCGNKLQPGDKFCENCGYKLTANNESSAKETKAVNQEKPAPQVKKREEVKHEAPATPKNRSTKDRSNKEDANTNETLVKAKAKLKEISNNIDIEKVKKEARNNPKKYGLIGVVVIVALIILGNVIHNVQMQPDHALVNKPYVMTMNTKTTTQGWFTNKTDNNTGSITVYLDSGKKKLYAGKTASEAKENAKNDEVGGSYTLSDSTLKVSSGDDIMGDIQINNIHRSGDEYVGNIQPISQDDMKISGTVTFRKA